MKASAIGKILSTLEKKYDANSLHEMHPDAEYMKKSPSANLGHSKQRLHMKVSIQSIPPFNPSKIRNSPSVDLTDQSGNETCNMSVENIKTLNKSELTKTVDAAQSDKHENIKPVESNISQSSTNAEFK